MCLCRKRPCCRFAWKHCTFCASHIFSIRVILILICIVDIIIMLWFLYAMEESREDITTCCGVTSNYPQPPINNNPSLTSNYSTCSNIDYSNIIIQSYYDILAPFDNKKYFKTNVRNYNWNQFTSIFTDYSMNITIDSNGGCVYNNYDNHYNNINCLSDTAMPCIQYKNSSIANQTNHELSNMCTDNLSNKELSYIQLGVLFIVIFKMLLIFIGICFKVCHKQIRPEDEYVYNLLHPLYIPSLAEQHKNYKRKQTRALLHRMNRIDSTPITDQRTEKSETIDMNGAKSYYVYYRMEDRRKNRPICCKLIYGCCYLIEYFFLFIVWLYKVIIWLFKSSFWLILLIINFLLSLRLFFIYHSPVLGIDTSDFCNSKQSDITCNISQNECGVINWIILPNIQKYLLPRFITLIFSLFAFLIRCIERCSGFKLQELVATKVINISGLNVNSKLKNAFQRISVSKHNSKITSQFNVRSGDELVDDLSVTHPSHVEMSNTESLPLNASQSKQKRKKLFSSLDILEDHRDTISSSDSNENKFDVLEEENDINNNNIKYNSLMDNLHQVTDEDIDDTLDDPYDIDQSQSINNNRKDILETENIYDSVKTGNTNSDISSKKYNEKGLKEQLESKHSLRGDVLLLQQDRNRGNSGQRNRGNSL